MEVTYTPSFIRQYKALDPNLQEEVLEKIEQFKNIKNHKALKVHKLTGRLKDRYSFSVNYKIRIVFQYHSKKEVLLFSLRIYDVFKR